MLHVNRMERIGDFHVVSEIGLSKDQAGVKIIIVFVAVMAICFYDHMVSTVSKLLGKDQDLNERPIVTRSS